MQSFRPAYPVLAAHLHHSRRPHRVRQRAGRPPAGHVPDEGRLVARRGLGGSARWPPRSPATAWPTRLDDRRDLVVRRLTPTLGPLAAQPHPRAVPAAERAALRAVPDEWSRIYERFGVPRRDRPVAGDPRVGPGRHGPLARQRARLVPVAAAATGSSSIGLSPAVIEAYNQTTQAPYCAAYLSILATMYGSFIPALSEHHAGGVNVGRTVINGERLGGVTSSRAVSSWGRSSPAICGPWICAVPRPLPHLRPALVPLRRDGVRQHRQREAAPREVPQERVFAMRAPRAIPVGEITRRTRLTAAEVQRFNPALTRQVPADANFYLPMLVPEFGPRRVVLASAAERRVRGSAGRLPPARGRRAALARGVVRDGAAGAPPPVRGDRHRGRHRDGRRPSPTSSATCAPAAAPPSSTTSARTARFWSCSSRAWPSWRRR